MIKRLIKVVSIKNEKLIQTDNVDVTKILVSRKELYGKKASFKYFVGYDDNGNMPLCIKLPQMIWYAKYFDSNKTISFKASDKRLLKNYIKIWEKISSLMRKKLLANLSMVIATNT